MRDVVLSVAWSGVVFNDVYRSPFSNPVPQKGFSQVAKMSHEKFRFLLLPGQVVELLITHFSTQERAILRDSVTFISATLFSPSFPHPLLLCQPPSINPMKSVIGGVWRVIPSC